MLGINFLYHLGQYFRDLKAENSYKHDKYSQSFHYFQSLSSFKKKKKEINLEILTLWTLSKYLVPELPREKAKISHHLTTSLHIRKTIIQTEVEAVAVSITVWYLWGGVAVI